MELDFNGENPIFQQIAEGLEDGILSGAFPEEGQIPSITEFSVLYKINPATALKGINLLVADGILYKRRGIGMFVAKGAEEAVKQKRRDAFYDGYVKPLVKAGASLRLTGQELLDMNRRAIEEGESK